MKAKPVFISYSHDSIGHGEHVLKLSERLRQDGIETLLDQYVNGAPQQGWPRWMLDQLDAAGSVLVVCTETYYRRFRGHEEPGKGKGVDWEGALINQEIYDSRSQTLKFVPVFLSNTNKDWIPEPLRSVSYYALTSETNYQRLYDFLLGRAGVEPLPVGVLKPRHRRKGTALTFGEPSVAQAAKVDISRIIKYAPAELIGREAETKLLADAWDKAVRGETKRPHVLTFVALGGEGKTSLVAKWAAELAHQDWLGCDAVFAWSFYSQGTREQAAVSSDVFLKEALTFFGDAEMAESAAGAFDKGRRLAQLVGERRALLILDGLEPLQYAPTSPTPGELKDAGLAAVLKGLAATNHGLCVVTTRYSIPDLRAYRQTTAPEELLLRLSPEAGVALLRTLGVVGSQRELEALVADVKGHALTLNLIGTFLRDAHAGDIRRRDLVKLEEADAEEQGGHAFHVMDAYMQSFETQKGRRALALLRLLGLFDRPATADCLEALWRGPVIPGLTEAFFTVEEKSIAPSQLNIALKRLEEAKLLTVNRDAANSLLTLDSHPLIREYFARRVQKGQPEAWRAAHRRLYDHLCETTEEGDRPTLDDLQPLYQAVAHGCQAGMEQEACDDVYRDRILRGGDHYSWHKLGAFGSEIGAQACFFETPWSRVSLRLKEATQAWLLNEAAFVLRALGRLTEALEPMRAALERFIKRRAWKEAAISAENLSELELTLGDLARAVKDAEGGVRDADKSGADAERIDNRTTHGDALYQTGRRVEAEALFNEAEEMQASMQPNYPLLYGVGGFQYCDLSLTEAERGAWHTLLGSGLREGVPAEDRSSAATSVVSCGAIAERAAQTLQWAERTDASLLAIALDHLTLGRAALYRFVLEPAHDQGGLTSAATELDTAVDGLRCAGQLDDLPRGLLTRAWCSFAIATRHRLLNQEALAVAGEMSAHRDLDEAWEIAERGPMPLFLADIHLYRARLFHAVTPYPWANDPAAVADPADPNGHSRGPLDDLAEARRLIEKHGYWRRKEELEDAEAAARDWPRPKA